MSDGLVPGFATAAGTTAYARRFPNIAPGHFRSALNGLTLSSVGLGTGGFTRRPRPESSVAYSRYRETVRLAVESGINVIDTAINYGAELAERIVGHALHDAFLDDAISRDQVVVATKGGYLPFPVEQYRERFSEAAEPVAGHHSVEPVFLRHQVEQSRRNLGLSVIDIYFIHNPEEQWVHVGPQTAIARLRRAFEALEELVELGWLRSYGVATAEGFRIPGPSFHPLEDVVALAHEVAGDAHHLAAIEVPFSLAMPEALTNRAHHLGGGPLSLLEAARVCGLCVLTSASIHRGRIPFEIPEALRSLDTTLATDVQYALQFARSVPGVVTALVGMSQPRHVEENAASWRHEPLDLLEDSAPVSAT